MNKKETLKIENLLPNASPAMMLKSSAYISLIVKWNKIYSLTATKTEEEIFAKHFLDSLTLIPFIQGKNILDFGSGAGFPGIPLAIFMPVCHFTLLDANKKKARFLYQAILNLPNVTAIAKRSENFNPEKPFDCIITRATSSLKNIVEQVKHLCDKNTVILAMKGKYPTEELKELDQLNLSYEVHKIESTELGAVERHIIRINLRK